MPRPLIVLALIAALVAGTAATLGGPSPDVNLLENANARESED